MVHATLTKYSAFGIASEVGGLKDFVQAGFALFLDYFTSNSFFVSLISSQFLKQ
jgi:hypothetical protein